MMRIFYSWATEDDTGILLSNRALLVRIPMASKEESRGEDLERQMDKMRVDFEYRLDKLQNKLNRSLEREARAPQGDEGLGTRLSEARDRVRWDMEESRDTIREHPLLVVGGALAVGLMLGALLAKD